ncbi:hypothetical protein N199_03940 [Helicobacter pylori UM038]|uniref:Uncharacterized protein n=1 Tax=Helicobacter pylori UM038 TaxID=1352343 RepID=A0AAV3JSU1_HELPX|nr:hypothetical protein N199_03940 [Helicobacter pylori UM038]
MKIILLLLDNQQAREKTKPKKTFSFLMIP